jgi:RNA polymerase sigma factor (sigma-70 family)
MRAARPIPIEELASEPPHHSPRSVVAISTIRGSSTRHPSHESRDYADDQRLIAAIMRGDRRAAGTLYDALRPIIDHTLRRVLHGRPSDFEDLVQTTFERIVRSIGEDRYEGRSRLTTWAAAIAGHVAMDAVRRKLREARFYTDTSPESDAVEAVRCWAEERRMEVRSEMRRIHATLSRMKPDLVHVLVLHDVLGYEVAEIAEVMKTGLSATHSRLARARKEFLRRAGARVTRGANQ